MVGLQVAQVEAAPFCQTVIERQRPPDPAVPQILSHARSRGDSENNSVLHCQTEKPVLMDFHCIEA